jgi:hypothetical protein
MPTPLNFGIEFAMSLLVFSLLAKWYVWPYLRARPFTQALLILLTPFLLRFLGLMSLVPGVVDPAVTQGSFAFYQAYGDFIAFLLALASFVLVRSGQKQALAVVGSSTYLEPSSSLTRSFVAASSAPAAAWAHSGTSPSPTCL